MPFNDKISDDWEIQTLSSYLPVITGKKNANTTSPDGQYPFFSCSQDVMWTKEYSFDANAILVAGNGDFNIKAYSGKFEAYQRTYVLIPNNPFYCGWLYYVVKHYLPNVIMGAHGSVINFITKGMLENISFPVPKNKKLLEYFCSLFNTIILQMQRSMEEQLQLEKLRLILLEQLSH